MGARAYLMVTVTDDVNPDNFVQRLWELEAMSEVDYVDPVEGSCDIVLMIEAPVSVSVVAENIAALPWVKSLETLPIVSLLERHRVSKKSQSEVNQREEVRL
jgi:hypothetical protein